MSREKISPDEFIKNTKNPKKNLSRAELEKLLNNSKPSKKKVAKSIKKKARIEDKDTFNALELFNLEIQKVPKLIEPFFQKIGLAALVGTSDTGKSTFLRQLCLSIVLRKKSFCGFALNTKYKKAIYVSTEDGAINTAHSIRKQIENIKDEKDDLELMKNLTFLFDSNDIIASLEKIIAKDPVDLIVIDAFTDVFKKELNANTQVRNFLNNFDKLAKHHKCLIVFLHHTGKKTQYNKPSKDSIIGSQAFESKMRSVIEIRNKNSQQKDLWILKSNFLDHKIKQESFVLNFSKDLTFSNSGLRGTRAVNSKSNNTELLNKIIELNQKGHSFRKIEELLKGTKFEVSKTVANNLFNKHKKRK